MVFLRLHKISFLVLTIRGVTKKVGKKFYSMNKCSVFEMKGVTEKNKPCKPNNNFLQILHTKSTFVRYWENWRFQKLKTSDVSS